MNDSFYKDIFYRAIIEIFTLSFDVDEQLLELKQKDSVTVYVKDRLGQTHPFKIIKKLRNFRFQYEIRIDDEHHHIRVTFFYVTS